MNIWRVIFLVIHIISAGLWISQFPVSFFFGLAQRNLSPDALPSFRMTQGRVLSGLGQLGGMGIILSGLGLIWADGWGLFGLTAFTPTWLIVKQVFYVIAMGIVGALVVPGQRKMLEAKTAADIDAAVNRTLTASHFVNLIVLVNIVLAVWRPF